MRVLPLVLLLASSTALAAPAADPATDAEACFRTDERGEQYPICFDPGDGLLLGTGLHMQEGEGAQSVRAGILIRTGRTSHSKGTPWFNSHRLLGVEAWGGERSGLTATAYDGTLRRHLEEGFILLPTARPVRIPFPFDVTFAPRLGHLERRVWEGPGWTLETARVGLLVDPVRSETGRKWLGLGPAASHTLRHSPEGSEHTVSPFTTLMLDMGLESADGLWALRASGLAGWSLGFEGGTFFRARAEAGMERVLFAVDDQPVVFQLSGAYVHQDAGLARRSEWTAGAGIAMRAFSARW
ncbi:hypothetical protein JY651_03530 [Pyxidicoccus parkwayensis]|uniref:Transporter n=1 Tax=Pyxidicoccus parkwayensis TaxID=2813578 RepID=A0ABX7NZA8_9BACT|nr:hypothetical protein [Pyxidicoccus parkwaysis]QSQ24063.1 hypothetical protein JY651_03530 [Pyxidicoccus parkwaysis]